MHDSKFEIKKMWRIIGTNESSILELRAIWPSGIETIKPALTKVFRASDHSGVDACKAAGINVPIIPGLKPIYTKKQLTIFNRGSF